MDALNAPMLAMSSDDEPRLYSRGYRDRSPVDELDPKQAHIHGKLVRWGAWARERGRGSSLASAESLYSGKGGTPPATAPAAADPQVISVERAITRMPMQHADTLRLLYVRRLTPVSICKAMSLRYEDWPKWIFDCRAMVENRIRQGSTGQVL